VTHQETLQPYFDYLDINPLDYAKNNSLDLVQELHKRHIAAIPFSSVGVLLEHELSLEIPKLMERMVELGYGGYCFEHNKLFSYAIESLGYNVRSVLARVLYNKDVEKPMCPKTHRLTLLELDEAVYVVDVGFGFSGPKQPVKLSMTPTPGPMGDQYRVANNKNGDYLLQILKDGEFFTLYSFDLNRYNESDFDMGHFYSHKHPQAGFVNNLVVARILDDQVLSLRNSGYQHIDPDRVQEQAITSHTQLQDILDTDFNRKLSSADCQFLFNKFCL